MISNNEGSQAVISNNKIMSDAVIHGSFKPWDKFSKEKNMKNKDLSIGARVIGSATKVSDIQYHRATLKVDNRAKGENRSRRGPRSVTSKYRGVTCYKRTGRW